MIIKGKKASVPKFDPFPILLQFPFSLLTFSTGLVPNKAHRKSRFPSYIYYITYILPSTTLKKNQDGNKVCFGASP